MSNRTQTPMAARTKMLLEAPVLATLFRLAAPNVFNLLALAGLITFDALIVGRLGADPLVGVSLVFPFVMFVQHVAASGVGGAVSSAIARALGAGDRQRANALCLHAFVLAIAMAAVLTVLMLSVGSTIYRLMGGRGVSLEAATAYSNAAFSGVIAVCMLNILANVVRGAGNMSLPALVLVGSVLGHVALSPLLIFGWGPLPALGVAGAGLGLVISFALGSLVLFRHLRSRRSLVRLAFTQGRLEWPLFREILRVGIPGMVNVAITNLAVVMITAVAARLGPEAAIGYAMGARLEYIMIPIAFGFGTALVALVGTNWGAQQYARVRRIGWTGALTVAAFCGAIGVFFAIFPYLWMALFTTDDAIARAGATYLRIAAPSYALFGLGMAGYFVMQGVGDVVPAVLANSARVVVSCAGAFAAVHFFDAGMIGVFVAIAAGFVTHGLLNAWLLARATRMATPSFALATRAQ